jgi:hypothetical protein
MMSDFALLEHGDTTLRRPQRPRLQSGRGLLQAEQDRRETAELWGRVVPQGQKLYGAEMRSDLARWRNTTAQSDPMSQIRKTIRLMHANRMPMERALLLAADLDVFIHALYADVQACPKALQEANEAETESEGRENLLQLRVANGDHDALPELCDALRESQAAARVLTMRARAVHATKAGAR